MFDAYEAGDYAGIRGGPFKFYYGYEETNIEEEWLFVAWVDGNEAARWTAEQLKMDQWDHPAKVLMRGIARFLDEVSDAK